MRDHRCVFVLHHGMDHALRVYHYLNLFWPKSKQKPGLNDFQRLLLTKALREEKTVLAVREFVRAYLGAFFTESYPTFLTPHPVNTAFALMANATTTLSLVCAVKSADSNATFEFCCAAVSATAACAWPRVASLAWRARFCAMVAPGTTGPSRRVQAG